MLEIKHLSKIYHSKGMEVKALEDNYVTIEEMKKHNVLN